MRKRFFDWLASGLWFKYRSMQRVFLPVVLALCFLIPVGAVAADISNTFFVAQYAGKFEGVSRTVGNMTMAAQASCAANTAITCVIVFDPVLSQYPQGVMPGQCANCVWIDYRGTNPFGSPSLYQYVGFRNRIINGLLQIDQRNAGAVQTITAGAALAYTVDHWYAYSTGGNVTGQQYNWQGGYQFTGGAGVTALAFGQRIESRYAQDLNSSVLSIGLWSNSLTSITWTAYVCNTQDACGTVASPTHTQIAGGTGTCPVSAIVSQCIIPLTFNSTYPAFNGVEIVFKTGAFTSGQLIFSGAQLEGGFSPTPFERRPYGLELALAQRYHYRRVSSGTSDIIAQLQASAAGIAWGKLFDLPVEMRVPPVCVVSSAAHLTAYNAAAGSFAAFTGLGAFATSTRSVSQVGGLTGASGLAAGNATVVIFNTASGYIDCDSEL